MFEVMHFVTNAAVGGWLYERTVVNVQDRPRGVRVLPYGQARSAYSQTFGFVQSQSLYVCVCVCVRERERERDVWLAI